MSRYLELAEEAMRDVRARRELENTSGHEVPDGTLSASPLQPQPFGHLHYSVRRWLAAKCVACAICLSNPHILHREFSRWSGAPCSEAAFVEELRRLDFPLDQTGMIVGLALGEDFLATCKYERGRKV